MPCGTAAPVRWAELPREYPESPRPPRLKNVKRVEIKRFGHLFFGSDLKLLNFGGLGLLNLPRGERRFGFGLFFLLLFELNSRCHTTQINEATRIITKRTAAQNALPRVEEVSSTDELDSGVGVVLVMGLDDVVVVGVFVSSGAGKTQTPEYEEVYSRTFSVKLYATYPAVSSGMVRTTNPLPGGISTIVEPE